MSCETVIGTLTLGGAVSTGPSPGERTACASAAVPGWFACSVLLTEPVPSSSCIGERTTCDHLLRMSE